MLTTTLAAATAAAAAAAATLLTKELLQRRRRRERSPPQKVSDLNEMRSRGPHLVPERLRVAFYFDLTAAAGRGCEHAEYLRNCGDVSTALDGLHAYVVGVLPVKSRLAAGKPRKGSIAINSATWLNVNDPKQTFPAVYSPERITPGEHFLLLEPDTRIEGGIFDLSEGSIYIGAGATVELGAYIRGPAHIGKGCVVRHSAYIRGDVVIGADSVVGCELKHMVRGGEARAHRLFDDGRVTPQQQSPIPGYHAVARVLLSCPADAPLMHSPSPFLPLTGGSFASMAASCLITGTWATRYSATGRTSAVARSPPTSPSLPRPRRRSRSSRGTL